MKETASQKDRDGTEIDDDASDHGSAWLAWLVAMPIVYVLSIGPVGLIAKNHPGETAILRKVYAPVIWLHENTPLRKPLEMYVGLFGVH